MEAGNEVEGVQSQEESQEPNEQRKGLKVEGAVVLEFAGCLFWLYQRRRGLWMQACLGRGLPGHALDSGRTSATAGILGIVSVVWEYCSDTQLEGLLGLCSGAGSGNSCSEMK